MTHEKIAIIGLGAAGSAIVYHLSKRISNDVIGYDQFDPPHSSGSSHGDSRITRLAIGENKFYSNFALRSHEIWRELENITKRSLYIQTGGLIMASPSGTTLHGNSDFIGETIRAAEEFNINHIRIDSGTIYTVYPQFNLLGNEVGYFEYEAGYLRPEECIRAQLEVAKQNRADIRTYTRILDISQTRNGGIKIITEAGCDVVDKVVIAAGSWVQRFLPASYRSRFEIHRQVLYWFEVNNPKMYKSNKFPVFIWLRGNPGKFLYGFPHDNINKGIKVASEEIAITDPDNFNKEVSREEVDRMYEYAREFIPGLRPKCVKTVVCKYTSTSDRQFVFDIHPELENTYILSACSGHGFKHSTAIGEFITSLLLDDNGRTDINLGASGFKSLRY